VRIESASLNNRRMAFVLVTPRGTFTFPYAKSDPAPTRADPVEEFFIDEELAGQAVTYRLASGREGFVHMEMAFDYNNEPAYMRDLLLYRLTLEAQDRLAASGLSHREVIRRIGTSPAQFYRLIDQTNYRKSVDKVLDLLQALDCEVELVVTAREPRGTYRPPAGAGAGDGAP
jgi:hypothetical protein